MLPKFQHKKILVEKENFKNDLFPYIKNDRFFQTYLKERYLKKKQIDREYILQKTQLRNYKT
jgi:hypothetical protein